MPEGKTTSHLVEELKGVGPKVSESLSLLGIKTIQDAVFHLPYRYEDRTKLTALGEAPYEIPLLVCCAMHYRDCAADFSPHEKCATGWNKG